VQIDFKYVEGGSVYTRTVQIAPGTLPDWTLMEMAVGDGVFLWIASKDTGHTDSEPKIDDRVANLYGLTAEEMKTIRGD
jgi:hypothetical protein